MGLNSPCWCGSAKKYKLCHLNRDKLSKKRPIKAFSAEMWSGIVEAREKAEAQELLRKSQQGKGKPIISTEFNGHRFVAVGNKLHFQPLEQANTFSDFLYGYILNKFTKEWWKAEEEKENPHTLIQWHCNLLEHRRKHLRGGVSEMPLTGVVSSFYNLAYNLYLLEHNVELQTHFINRLKNEDLFFPAMYETYISAWFTLTGFSIDLEEEADPSITHVEFVATAENGEKFSVEAKQRQANKDGFAIGNQLAKALKKEATSKRIVCIDLNVSQERILEDQESFITGMNERITDLEQKLYVNGEPAPEAYLFITNHPYHLHLSENNIMHFLLIDGFKIPDFNTRRPFALIEAFKSNQKHQNIWRIVEVIKNYSIPSTFDGKLPEETFGEMERRFVLGQPYKLPNSKVGKITDALVNVEKNEAVLLVHTGDDQVFTVVEALTDEEVQAYKRHPETFFGKIRKTSKNTDTPLELFEFFYDSMKGVTRDKMLEWFKDASDLELLEALNAEELLLKYIERHVQAVFNQKTK